jgi:hypothetical protein
MNNVTINNHVISIKEYMDQRVVTFKDIDTVHNRPESTARKRFNDNKKHFIEGVDYFKVKCSEVRPFFGQTPPNGFNPDGDIILITETGYLMLVKSFTDDLAWAVQRELVNCYFRVKEFPQERQYISTRPLTTDDYTEAAKTIAKCHNSRLPIVIDLYKKAGLDITEITRTDTEQMVEDDLVELLSQYTLNELCALLNLAKSTVYYYRTGKVKPRNKRKQYIVQTLKGTVIT